jgi:uncharacterized protein
MKFIVVVVVVTLVLWYVLRRDFARARPRAARKQPPQAIEMVRCAYCGVHLPVDEAVRDGAARYCSEAHRAHGPRES